MIGRQIEFADVPAELEALERRETTGRTVVRTPTGPGRPPERRVTIPRRRGAIAEDPVDRGRHVDPENENKP